MIPAMNDPKVIEPVTTGVPPDLLKLEARVREESPWLVDVTAFIMWEGRRFVFGEYVHHIQERAREGGAVGPLTEEEARQVSERFEIEVSRSLDFLRLPNVRALDAEARASLQRLINTIDPPVKRTLDHAYLSELRIALKGYFDNRNLASARVDNLASRMGGVPALLLALVEQALTVPELSEEERQALAMMVGAGSGECVGTIETDLLDRVAAKVEEWLER